MNDRRQAVHDWRWTEDRQKAPTLASLYGRWPDMIECPHDDLDIRTLRNSYGAVMHVECLNCPSSHMSLVKPDELRRVPVDTIDRYVARRNDTDGPF